MATFVSSGIKNLPAQFADGIVKDVQTGSTVAALSGQEPMKFGDVTIVTFNDLPRAEFVGETDEKSSTTAAFGSVNAVPRKAQVTMRFSEEVQWADEDYQLGVLAEVTAAGAAALSRALDLGVYHRLNPLTGRPLTGWANYLDATTMRVTATSAPDEDLEAAAQKVLDAGKTVGGIAMDPSFAWDLATARYPDDRKKYPELGLGVGLSAFGGLPASVSNTVSGRPEAMSDDSPPVPEDLGLRAIVGDFTGGIRWGIQRQLPVRVITSGDPDGGGDLARKNEIAIRLEILYAWYVFTDRFAVVEEA